MEERRVLLFPLPLQGHINPMLQLASLLFARRFSITIFHTQFNSIDATKYPFYDFISVDDEGVFDRCNAHDIPRQILALNSACEKPFHDCLMKIISNTKDKKIACLITDIHLYNMQASARQLGVATLVLRTSSAAGTSWFPVFPLLLEKGYIPIQESRLDEPVEELPPFRVRDLFRMDKSDQGDISKHMARGTDTARNSSGVIINTFDAIESAEIERLRRDFSVPMFAVGPLHKISSHLQSSLLSQDASCLDWLERQSVGSVLYVSFGSLASLSYDEFVETAWGLANSGEPFLWVIRPGLVSGMDSINLPDIFEEVTRGRGIIVSWAPQIEVLAHKAVGGFWTHAGWNSTLEAISEGVPMLCRPYFADQMGNTRYITHVWKVGFELKGKLEREEIQRTVKRLMRDGEGNEMRERMNDLKNQAADCIKQDGSTCVAINELVDHILSF
ncbi:hypothetical protein LUZ60_000846 [Juncus effusus]|nr:hypothetical protein LUZ60_000846 [Juncus effusus]